MSRLTRQYTVLRPPCSFRFRPPIHLNSSCVCTFYIYATKTKNNLITSEYTYILAMITYGSVGDKQSIPKVYAEFPILNEICFSMMQFSCSTFKSPWNIFSKCFTLKGSNPPYLSLKTGPFLSSRGDGWRWDQTFNSLRLISRRHANIENLYQSYIPNMDTISMIMRRESWKAALGDILVGQTRLMKFGMAPQCGVHTALQTSRMKIGGVSLICNTVYFLLHLSLWSHFERLYLRNRGSVTQTKYIFWILSAWGFRGYQPWKISPLKIFGYGAIYKKSSLISVSTCKKSTGLMYPQFWCHRPSQWLVWTVIPQTFKGYP